MSDEHRPEPEPPLDPQVLGVLEAAYRVRVGVDAAAAHLWAIHRAAARHAAEVGGDRAPGAAAADPGDEGAAARGAARSATAGPPANPGAPSGRRREPRLLRAGARLAVAAVGFAALLGFPGAAVAASGQALPGEALYPVKVAAERLSVVMAVGADRDARVQLRIAENRLGEAAAMAPIRPDTLPRLLGAALDALDRAEVLAGPHLVGEVAATRSRAEVVVADLADVLGVEALALLEPAADRLGTALAAAAPPVAPPVPAAAPLRPREEEGARPAPSGGGAPVPRVAAVEPEVDAETETETDAPASAEESPSPADRSAGCTPERSRAADPAAAGSATGSIAAPPATPGGSPAASWVPERLPRIRDADEGDAPADVPSDEEDEENAEDAGDAAPADGADEPPADGAAASGGASPAAAPGASEPASGGTASDRPGDGDPAPGEAAPDRPGHGEERRPHPRPSTR